MAPLEQPSALEIEFHRRRRCDTPGSVDASVLHKLNFELG
jgi:hypothetical protein